jgi:hypothetical protein
LYASSSGSLLLTEVTARTGGAIAGETEPDTVAAISISPAPAANATPVNGEREDLTMFFSIGVIVDVLLVTAFLIWAVGQWRKARK